MGENPTLDRSRDLKKKVGMLTNMLHHGNLGDFLL